MTLHEKNYAFAGNSILTNTACARIYIVHVSHYADIVIVDTSQRHIVSQTSTISGISSLAIQTVYRTLTY